MAANYAQQILGGTNDQYNRVFNQTGAYGSLRGNAIISTSGKQAGGRRRRGRTSRFFFGGRRRYTRRRGGNLTSVLGQAATPLALLASQQYYKKQYSNRKNKNGPFSMIPSFQKSRRHRRRSFQNKKTITI